jgi:mono/diheme cytochrome c family protein
MPGPAPSEADAPPPLEQRLPLEQRARYETFAQKCGRCHGPEKALDAGLSAAEWDDYLKKKNKRSGAGISDRQLEEIAAFLRYWATAPR